MMAVDITSGPGFVAGSPRLLFEVPLGSYGDSFVSYDVAPDGRFLGIRDVNPDPPTNQINVVLNWFEELKRRVPTRSQQPDAHRTFVITYSSTTPRRVAFELIDRRAGIR